MSATTATAIITASVAVIVALIAWGQWVTNRARLRHELFDRRYEVYEQIGAFLAEVLQTGRIPPGEPEGFLRRTKKAYFVFACDREVDTLVKDIYRKAVELHAQEETLKGLTGEARSKNLAAQTAVKEWFRETLGAMETTFEEYLNLKH